MLEFTITMVMPWTKEEENGEKREMLTFEVAGREKPIWASLKEVARATGFPAEADYSVLVGCTFYVEFFKKGEVLLNKKKCTSNDTVKKSFKIKLSGGLRKLKAMGQTNVSYAGELDMDA